MGTIWRGLWVILAATVLGAVEHSQQASGTIRGVVYDKNFETALPGVRVLVLGSEQAAISDHLGSYAIAGVAPGAYSVVFARDGYVRSVRTNVSVTSGQLTDLDAWLSGDFTEMPPLVVRDSLRLNGGGEAALLNLRFESPSFLDSVSSELMSQAGASDAAAGLSLVSGASVQDGKFAVIRGLPDRYVSSQVNAMRLPTADADTRAVELDQFPSSVIDSIQVSKTFTPDQQGDSSGGAVDVRLRGVPEGPVLELRSQISYNSQVTGRTDFLTYEGGGFDAFGDDDNARRIQTENLDVDIERNWDGATGVERSDAPVDFKLSTALGGQHRFDNGIKIGGVGSFFYDRDSSFFDNGIDDSYWVRTDADGELTPRFAQGSPDEGEFLTRLYDIEQGSRSVQWGGVGVFGIETRDHSLGLAYLYSRTAEDTATLAEDTRGKATFFDGYDVDDPMSEGNLPDNQDAAPYQRLETLRYNQRTTGTLQFSGDHSFAIKNSFLSAIDLSWTYADSFAVSDTPDKRQFGSVWKAASFEEGNPVFGQDPFVDPPIYEPLFPAANVNLGNFQRIFERIEEYSDQLRVDVALPFEGAAGEEGALRLGVFEDKVKRTFDQNTFSNFGDSGSDFLGSFDDFWSASFNDEFHPIVATETDIDYDGRQEIEAWYGMVDIPISQSVGIVGGVRIESTEIGTSLKPEENALWFPPEDNVLRTLGVAEDGTTEADVAFSQTDKLPALGVTWEASENVTVRSSYSQTVARQTFKELTPVLQQEFAGGPIFVGNPELRMSALENYDIRVDYTPFEGGLLSASYFYKDIEDPIEFVQRPAPGFTYTTAINYPKGELSGFELEARQDLGEVWNPLDGLTLGANATFIDSEVRFPDEEIERFAAEGVDLEIETRDATNAPEHLYNIYATYNMAPIDTQLAVFYTVRGDTLVAGAGLANPNFVPDIYAKEFGTLNLSLTKRLGKRSSLRFQAKNLTNPSIDRVYRSEFTGEDVTQSSFTRGIEYSLSLNISF